MQRMPYRSNITEAAVKLEGDVDMAEVANNGSGKEMPAWLTKIKEGGIKKVPKDVQKRRRNFRLKKMLTPKSPMMVLFELVNRSDIQFDNFIVDPLNRLLKITARYDGKVFEGVGPSKSVAKNICSEQILQHIVFKSCLKDAENEKAGLTREEETPWTALASVALFKLFNDWQAQGVSLPAELIKGKAMNPSLPVSENDDPMMDCVTLKFEEPEKKKNKRTKEPKGPKTLPENPTSRHPVQLLNEMEGQQDYCVNMEGAPPSTMFHITVTVNSQTFTGSAKNKKEAKKLAAQSALAALYEVHYPA